MTGHSNDKCEYLEVEIDDSQLFTEEEKQICTLHDCECVYDGEDDVCPFKIGVFY